MKPAEKVGRLLLAHPLLVLTAVLLASLTVVGYYYAGVVGVLTAALVTALTTFVLSRTPLDPHGPYQ